MAEVRENQDFLQPLKDASLKASGYGFLLGDAALFAAGCREGNAKAASAGLFWALGGLSAAYGGNPNAEKQLELLSRRLGRHLREENIMIPPGPTTALLRQHGGLLTGVQDFLYKHPADILNSFSLLGAGALIHSGLKNQFKPDIASGVLVGAGGLAGLLIQEKKPDPNQPPQGMIAQAASWIQERPLRVTGSLQAINNLAMFWGSRAKQQQANSQGSYVLRYAAAASYLFANVMLFMSSKENDRITDPQVMQRLGELSAQVVAAQPEAVQAALLEDITHHLAVQPGSLPEAEIKQLLESKLTEIKQKSGLAPMGWQHKIAVGINDQSRIAVERF